MEFSEKTTKTEEIYKGKIIRVRKDEVLLETGSRSTREIVEHPGGVTILALDSEGYTYLVRQFRKPFEEITLELPAGKLEYGEEPLECAKRELSEETGFTAGKYTYIGAFYPTPGFCTEQLHIYLAEELSAGEPHFDPDERLEIIKIKLCDAIELIKDRTIKDAKTVIGLQSVYISKELGK